MASHPVFRVENLGPIRRGEVELRPLTLLIGKNNTGKTYMAQAIHACHKALQADIGDSLPTLAPADLEALEDLVSAAPTPDPLATPPGVIPIVEQWIRARFQAASACLPEQMQSVYGYPRLEYLDSWGSDRRSSIAVHHHSGNGSTYLFGNSDRPPEITVSSFDLTKETATTIRNRIFEEHKSLILRDSDDGNESPVVGRIRLPLATSELVWNQQLHEIGFGARSYYLPAGRSGLLKTAADVIQTRLHVERDHGDRGRHTDAPFGGVPLEMVAELQDIFTRALRHGSEPRPNGDAITAALTLLEQTIDGTVVVEAEDGLLPVLMYQQNDRKLPLNLVSAMVAELAPLHLWTREIIATGDLLIVDEPEVHLHPEARRQVARALVRLVNAGVKVLCVTQSCLLIHQISNCMLASAVAEEYLEYLEEDLGFPPEDRIPVSDIGVFRFMRPHDTAQVEIVPQKIDTVWGVPEDEYVNSTEQIINESGDLARIADS